MAITQEHINSAIQLAKEYGATRLLLFGSALDDPDNANDLDLGVDGLFGLKFFQYGGILETLIDKQVDIVDLSLDNVFINHIKQIGRYIYDSYGKVN